VQEILQKGEALKEQLADSFPEGETENWDLESLDSFMNDVNDFINDVAELLNNSEVASEV
jgi:hypothetical protein